ncbi:uncharacterized protein CLUP02_05065 [Colletotrichum lupini]|uniref:Uncharacterized protein n=1 Tax=Colletotrichum lupini TaxID=145971 RepID=A0A9Q8SME6_9PEZI|nr:uncharacterized protein CLUP02_05065 [Colletotrichum lupini]UQC79585.1 hypothetical protein CLUP02_05065 [Colletotrichum lupini]
MFLHSQKHWQHQADYATVACLEVQLEPHCPVPHPRSSEAVPFCSITNPRRHTGIDPTRPHHQSLSRFDDRNGELYL